MRPLFVDTSYYFALLNAADEWHGAAMDLTNRLEGSMVTTAWVLTELANAMARGADRAVCVDFIQRLRSNPNVAVVPPTQALFDLGFDLYVRRPDKDWSLTDCISFVVMRENGLAEALTGDQHFEQAGFKALLRP